MNPARLLLVLPIRAYQRFLSPLKPPTCRFHPSCSHYATGAIETHGVLKGLLLGTWRVLRCQPFSEAGPDPVPPAADWRMPFRRGYRKAWLEPQQAAAVEPEDSAQIAPSSDPDPKMRHDPKNPELDP